MLHIKMTFFFCKVWLKHTDLSFRSIYRFKCKRNVLCVIVFVWFLFCINPISVILLQVVGDRCGTGQSLFGQRKLPRAVLLHREASEVLSDWCSSGGEMEGCCFMQHHISASLRGDQVFSFPPFVGPVSYPGWDVTVVPMRWQINYIL